MSYRAGQDQYVFKALRLQFLCGRSEGVKRLLSAAQSAKQSNMIATAGDQERNGSALTIV